MTLSLKSFVKDFIYPNEMVEISGVGPNVDGNTVRYEGSVDEIPAELLDYAVEYVTMNGRMDDPFTIRIECDFESDVGRFAKDFGTSLESVAANILYDDEEVEIAGVGPDVDGNFVRFEGKASEIPDELKNKTVRFITSAGQTDSPFTLRIECDF